VIRLALGDLSAILSAFACGRTNTRIRGWLAAPTDHKIKACSCVEQIAEVGRRHPASCAACRRAKAKSMMTPAKPLQTLWRLGRRCRVTKLGGNVELWHQDPAE
jgi:hypothetical protein